MSTVGEAVIRLKLDGKNVKGEMKNVESSVESSGSKIGAKVASIGKNIGKVLSAGFAVASASVVAFAKSSIDAFNEQEKAIAKLEQSAKNQNWYAGATKDLMAYNAELQKVGIIGDEVNAAGQAQLGTFALSAETVKTLTPAMDNLIAATSGYEATTDSATQMANLMGKVMTGNVGALTRYGVTLDENQKKLLETGTEAERAATLVEVLDQNFGGFNETLAQTPQGQVKQLSNNFGDLKEMFGAFMAGQGDLTGLFDQITLVFNNIVGLVSSMGPELVGGITVLVQSIADALPKLINELAPTVIQGVIDIALTIIEQLPTFLKTLQDILLAVANALIENADTILDALTTVIIELVNMITRPDYLNGMVQAAIKLFMKIVDALPDIIVALVDALPNVIDNIIGYMTNPTTIQMMIDASIKLFMAIVKAVPRILGALLNAFGSVVGSLWNHLTNLFGTFAANFGNFIGGVFKGAINGVLAFIEGFINTPINLINAGIDAINKIPGVDIGKIGNIYLPRLATGGITTGATTAIIGEAGQEAVLPLQNNTDNWAGTLASILTKQMEEDDLTVSGKEMTVVMNNNISNRLDAQEVGRVMTQSMRRYA